MHTHTCTLAHTGGYLRAPVTRKSRITTRILLSLYLALEPHTPKTHNAHTTHTHSHTRHTLTHTIPLTARCSSCSMQRAYAQPHTHRAPSHPAHHLPCRSPSPRAAAAPPCREPTPHQPHTENPHPHCSPVAVTVSSWPAAHTAATVTAVLQWVGVGDCNHAFTHMQYGMQLCAVS